MKDAHSRFGLTHVQIGGPLCLSRFLVGFSLALCWLALLALPHLGARPEREAELLAAWHRA